MRRASLFALSVLAAAANTAAAADSYAVVGIAAADRVVLDYRGLPVAMTLAHIDIPADQAAPCRDKLKALVTGKRVEILYAPDFGVDASGAARVQLQLGSLNINEALVAAGLAKYQPTKPDTGFEKVIARAEDKAKKAKAGVWAVAEAKVAAKPPAAPASVATGGSRPSATVKSMPAASGPFCSELDSEYYYLAGAREVANVSSQRLIFYASEAAAEKAGKRKRQAVVTPAGGDGSVASADAVFAQGEEVYAKAIAAGNTPERDHLYEQAYVYLTKGMNLYSALVEKKPDDEQLAEKLRKCMQLRYGTVKQRRFAH